MFAAKINDLNIVERVIVGDATWAQDALGGKWVESQQKVGIGWIWSAEHGIRPPQPYASWTWSGDAWLPPVLPPNEFDYVWDEDTLSWIPLEATDESNP